MALLRALQRHDVTEAQRLYDLFLPLETLRDSISLIRVLHDAVTWSGVADMGAQLPLLSSSPIAMRGEIEATARLLLAADASS
jgi:dihydrodipicolinate synthase/N-acetylneuraminate lyase